MQTDEKDIEAKFCRAVQNAGGWAVKFTSPGLAGVPDRLVILADSSVCFAEMKKLGKKMRPLQKAVKHKLESYGLDVWLIDSDAAITAFIKEMQIQGKLIRM